MFTKSIYSFIFLFSAIACSEAKETSTEVINDTKKEPTTITTIKEVVELPTKEIIEQVTEEIIPEKAPETMKETVILSKKETVKNTPKEKEEITIPEVIVPQKVTETEKITTVSHAVFNSLLKKYVTSTGVVNYAGFKTEHSKLKGYINTLKANSPKASWTRNEKLAYWINIYNALTIDLLLNNYPLKSIMKIDKAWDKNVVTIDGKNYTLNTIENKVIRPTFKEPRIHFAVNCGAKSCPKLLNEAFTAGRLNAQLQKQTIAFINNTSQNELTENKVKISKIFEWYASDFGNITTFLAKYSKTTISPKAKVSYNEYNWDLNGK